MIKFSDSTGGSTICHEKRKKLVNGDMYII